MADTLFDATYRVARALGAVTLGQATGGTTSTLIDTNDLTQPDDHWNGGTVWILEDAGGASAAPEGEYGIISDFDNGTNTATLRSALTVAPASSDKYAIARDKYPLYKLIEKVNEVLTELGPIMTVDTSLSTASAQTEYTLPAAANFDLREVRIQGYTNDANDNRWVKVHDWRIEKTATGTGDTLIFPVQYPTSRTIQLVYMAPHAEILDFDDTISELIHLDRLSYEAALRVLEWYEAEHQSEDSIDRRYQRLQLKAAQAEAMYPIRKPKRHTRLMSPWGRVLATADEFKEPDE